jgi:triosephosphate isomerase (TIM)
MRKPFVAGNWKMHTTSASAVELASAIVKGLGSEDRVTVAVCPPFPYLSRVAEVLRGSRIALGAQNMWLEKEGAFTGEVSPTMLLDLGCRYVILGHSERRHKLGEADALINQKVRMAVTMGLQPILCVGETLEERDGNQTEAVLERQLRRGLAQVDKDDFKNVVLAYEPVWAIGTGRNATPDQAEQACAFIRRTIADIFGENPAQQIPIQYGGSVKPENAKSLMSQPDVDGALVGGACLVADQFLAIIRAALPI